MAKKIITALLESDTEGDIFFHQLDQLNANIYQTYRDRNASSELAMLAALKLCNLLASDFHYKRGNTAITSFPPHLMMDPSNACQLQCPGCVHSDNKSWSNQFDWPSASLSLTDTQQFLDALGPYATHVALFNYGEPLLNRRFPEIVAIAKSFLLDTVASSNLAMPIDPIQLVRCGLDRLVVSIDGITQSTYEQFRRRGKLNQVLQNLELIINTRSKLEFRSPYITWQMLTFEHNQEDVDKTIEIARDMGVDELNITTPFSVDRDTPSIKAISHPKAGRYVFSQYLSHAIDNNTTARIDLRKHVLHSAFTQSWVERWKKIGKEEKRKPPRCSWPYHNMTLDGASRMMPCCKAPKNDTTEGELVLGELSKDGVQINHPQVVATRRAVTSEENCNQFLVESEYHPHCLYCQDKVAPALSTNFGYYFECMDDIDALSKDIYEMLNAHPFFSLSTNSH